MSFVLNWRTSPACAMMLSQLLVDAAQIRVPDGKRPSVGQPRLEEVIAEQAPVIELVFGPFGQAEGIANPLELCEGIGGRAAHPLQHAEMHSRGTAAIDGHQAVGDGNAGPARPAGLDLLLDEHEVQRIKVTGGGNQQGVCRLVSKRRDQGLAELDGQCRGLETVHLKRRGQPRTQPLRGNPADTADQVLGPLRDAKAGSRLFARFAGVVAQGGQQLLDPRPIARRLYRGNVDSSWPANHGSPP